jgi:hypothetical protein
MLNSAAELQESLKEFKKGEMNLNISGELYDSCKRKNSWNGGK